MTETEVERLVVRLIGDSSSFKKAFDDAAKATEEFKQAASELTKTEKFLEQQQQKIAQIMEQSKTSAQKYAEQIKELDALLNATTTAEEHHAVSLRRSQVAQEAANASTKEASAGISEVSGRMVMAGAAIAAVGAAITGSLLALGTSAINQAAQFEQTVVSFEAMLGSQQQAQKVLSDLTKFAAATPFTMPTLLSATKMLLQFKVPAKEVMGILKSIGDVTGGSDPSKVQAMAYAFSQMSAAGRLMGQDLMQMINAGFNPLAEMSKTTGKSLADLRQEMSDGRITAEMVKEAFASASERLDLMGKQAQTLEGRMSTLDDNMGLFWRSIGEQLLPIKVLYVDVMTTITAWLQALSPEWKRTIAYVGLFAVIVGSAITSAGGFMVTIGLLAPVLTNAASGLLALSISLGVYTTAELTAASAAHVSQVSQLKLIAVKLLYAPILSLTTSLLGIQATITTALTGKTWGQVAAEAFSLVQLKLKAVATGTLNLAMRAYAAVTGLSSVATTLWSGVMAAGTAVVALFTGGVITATAAVATFWIVVTLGAAAVVAAIVLVVMLVTATKKYNDELQRTVDLNNQMKEKSDKRTDKTIASGNLLEGQDKVAFFEKEMETAKQAELQTTKSLENAKKAMKDAEPTWLSLGLSGWLTDASYIAKENLTEAEAAAERAKSAAEKMKDALLNAGGTAAIEAEFKALSDVVRTYEEDLKKVNDEIKKYKNLSKPTKEQTEGFEKSQKAAKTLTDSVGMTKTRLEELEKMKDVGMTAEGSKSITEFNKNLKKTGDPLHDAMTDARLFDPKVKQEARDKFTAAFDKNTEHQRGLGAVSSILQENKKYEEQISLVGKVGAARKRAETELQIEMMKKALPDWATDPNFFKNASDARRRVEEEIAQAIEDSNVKREQGIAMIGKYGVELAKAKAMQEQGVTDPNDPNLKFDAGREQKNINAEFLANYNKELATTVALSGKYGAALEFAKMQQQGLTEGVTLAMVADKMNADTLSKTTVELTKQAEAIEAMGFDAFLIAKGFDKAGQSSATLNAMYKEYEKSKQNSVDETIKKLHEEASLVGKTGFDAWKQQEKNKGNVYSNEQEASMKQAFDSTDAAKANEQFLPPVEKYEREMKKIEDMRKAGLSDPAYEQLVKKAQEEMYKAPSGPGARTIDFKSQMTEGLNANSAQAQRMIAITAMQRGYGNTGSIGASRAASVAGRGGRGGGGGGRGGVGGGGAVPVDPLTKVDSEKDSAQNMAASLKELVSLARLQLAKPAVEFMEAGLT